VSFTVEAISSLGFFM